MHIIQTVLPIQRATISGYGWTYASKTVMGCDQCTLGLELNQHKR